MRYHHLPNHLTERYVERMRATYAARAQRLAAIRTEADARAWQAHVRDGLNAAFGPLPPRTPLVPRVWRTDDHGAFRIDQVTFESRPGFLVSANLYLPAGAHNVPGVLFTCGHSANGKAYALYNVTCQRLVRAGYAVLAYDPINQGERDLYSHLDTGGRLTRQSPCDGHNIIGRQLHACGEWLGAWRVWDGLRALDYLAQRPEVDGAQLAVTGQSGGGTLSAYLWAMEPRFRAVASSCWTSSYLLDIENGMPADEEQYPPGWLAAGLDKIDFFTVRAGQPTLLLGQEQDFFDDRGLRAGHAELTRLNKLLGGKDSLCRVSFDTGTHAYSEANQVAMVSFFDEVFGRTSPTATTPLVALDDAALTVTPKGDVVQAGSRPMGDLVAERARAVAAERKRETNLAAAVREALGVRLPAGAPHHRRLFQTSTKRAATGQQVHRFAIEAEPGRCCILRHITRGATAFRLNPPAVATLYLPNIDAQTELDDQRTMAGTDDFFALDPRGLGEGLHTLDDPRVLYGHDYMAAGHAVMYGESLLGDRVSDVLAAARLLRAEGAREVRLVGRGQGGLLALLAGLLDPAIPGITVRETPESFLALATAPYTWWPAACLPHGVLARFDLPEVRAALGGRLSETEPASPGVFV